MKHIILAAVLLAASPAMAKQKEPAVDLTGLYDELMLEVGDAQLPPVPEAGPYGEPARERDIVAPAIACEAWRVVYSADINRLNASSKVLTARGSKDPFSEPFDSAVKQMDKDRLLAEGDGCLWGG
jgi:hypothetical protein